MTTSTIENREPARATEKREAPQKAKIAAPKARVTSTKAKSAHKTTPAKNSAEGAHKATGADCVRLGSKTAKVLELLKRSGATLKSLMKATGWQTHFRARLPFRHLGQENGPEDRVPQNQ